MPSNEPNGWNEWSKFVLKELERLNTCYENLDDKMNKIIVDITMLKVKSGLWGAVAGAIPAVVVLIIFYLKSQNAN